MQINATQLNKQCWSICPHRVRQWSAGCIRAGNFIKSCMELSLSKTYIWPKTKARKEAWDVDTPAASNSIKGTPCNPSFPGQEQKQKTEQLPLIHVFIMEQQPVRAPDVLPHALLMSHMLWACGSTDWWPRYTCLSNSQVEAPCRVPACSWEVPFVSSWVSLVFTGNWHYYLLIAVMWQQWTYLHVPEHLLQNVNTKAIYLYLK